jgi:hypothetical protein
MEHLLPGPRVHRNGRYIAMPLKPPALSLSCKRNERRRSCQKWEERILSKSLAQPQWVVLPFCRVRDFEVGNRDANEEALRKPSARTWERRQQGEFCDKVEIQCVFISLKMPEMKSVTSLVAMQKKDTTCKLVIVFHVTFLFHPLTSLNVSGHAI